MKKLFASFICATIMLTGCATNGSSMMSSSQSQIVNTQGVIIGTKHYNAQTTSFNGTGAVVGGVAGGALGHQIGKGNGRKVATVLGALAGAAVGGAATGDTINNPMIELTIQEANSNVITITQPDNMRYFVGQHVNIVKQGSQAQVTPSQY
jgi:outer membrane lipoprotein SlyB